MHGNVERVFVGVFVSGFVRAIGNTCLESTQYPRCFTSLLLSFMLYWSHCHIAPPIPTRAHVHADNWLGPEGAKALVPALQAMTQLKSLNLRGTLPPPTPGDIVCVCLHMHLVAD